LGNPDVGENTDGRGARIIGFFSSGAPRVKPRTPHQTWERPWAGLVPYLGPSGDRSTHDGISAVQAQKVTAHNGGRFWFDAMIDSKLRRVPAKWYTSKVDVRKIRGL